MVDVADPNARKTVVAVQNKVSGKEGRDSGMIKKMKRDEELRQTNSMSQDLSSGYSAWSQRFLNWFN